MQFLLKYCVYIFVYADMQIVCKCIQCLNYLNYYETFLKLSVNLNLHMARFPTPDTQLVS